MKAGVRFAAVLCVGVMVALPAMAQDDGAAIYKSKCEHCHGADGMSHTFAGKMTSAAKFGDPEVAKMTDADWTAVVKGGKKKMPAFGKKLTDNQIAAVVAYVRTLQTPAAN